MTEALSEQRRRVGAPPQAYAVGCGKRVLMVEMCPPGTSPGARSCTWTQAHKLKREALIRRASFDLSCDRNLVRTQPLDARTVGVSACESQVTYVWSCPHNPAIYSGKCTWLMNNESLRRPPPPAPAFTTSPQKIPPPPASTAEPSEAAPAEAK